MSGTVNVGLSPVKLLGTTPTPRAQMLFNYGATRVWVNDQLDVLAGQGLPLDPGGSLNFTTSADREWYGVAETTLPDVPFQPIAISSAQSLGGVQLGRAQIYHLAPNTIVPVASLTSGVMDVRFLPGLIISCSTYGVGNDYVQITINWFDAPVGGNVLSTAKYVTDKAGSASTPALITLANRGPYVQIFLRAVATGSTVQLNGFVVYGLYVAPGADTITQRTLASSLLLNFTTPILAANSTVTTGAFGTNPGPAILCYTSGTGLVAGYDLRLAMNDISSGLNIWTQEMPMDAPSYAFGVMDIDLPNFPVTFTIENAGTPLVNPTITVYTDMS